MIIQKQHLSETNFRSKLFTELYLITANKSMNCKLLTHAGLRRKGKPKNAHRLCHKGRAWTPYAITNIPQPQQSHSIKVNAQQLTTTILIGFLPPPTQLEGKKRIMEFCMLFEKKRQKTKSCSNLYPVQKCHFEH